MDQWSGETWLVFGVLCAGFVLAMLSVLARCVAEDKAQRDLRREVTRLRREYEQRERQATQVAAEQERIDAIMDSTAAARKAA
jgi:uncharacterized protein YhaN